MSNSALVGQKPITNNDKLIYKALHMLSPETLNPDKRYPLGPPPPPDASYGTRGPSIITGSSFAIALIIIITGARLYVRTFQKHAFGADDWVIIPAALGAVAYLSLNIASVTAGCLGKHLYECTYHELGWFAVITQIYHPLFYFTVFLVKISIVLQNRRLTGVSSGCWQIAHWIYLAFLICITPTCVFLNMFPCRPIATSYTLQSIAMMPDVQAIRCLNRCAISYSRVLHIITDWLLLPVPLIIIYRLQMPVWKKVRIACVFFIGLVCSIATLMRNILAVQVSTDVPYDWYDIYAWNAVDIFFATIVAIPSCPEWYDRYYRPEDEEMQHQTQIQQQNRVAAAISLDRCPDGSSLYEPWLEQFE